MRYEYAGGVATPEERDLLERFERDLLPYLEKHGPYIGELAMAGWKVAEEIVLRHNGLVEGAPEARAWNLSRLMAALSIWKERWEEVRRDGVSVAGAQPAETVH